VKKSSGHVLLLLNRKIKVYEVMGKGNYLDLDKFEVGDPLPDFTKSPITKVQLVRYAGASGDFNPIHTDDTAAKKMGLKGVIAHGPLIMGFASQAICRWVPKYNLRRFKVRLMGRSYPGDVITISATVVDKTETRGGTRVLCEIIARDQNEEKKLSGYFEVVIHKWKGEIP